MSRFERLPACPALRGIFLLLICLVGALGFSCASNVDVDKIFVQANSDDYDERAEARAKLLELVQQGRVEPFAKGLHSKSAETRAQSILHLMVIQKPEATSILVGELALNRRFMAYYNPIRLVPVSTAKDSRIMVAHIVSVRGGDPRAVKILSETYGREPDVETRIATLYSLGALEDPTTIPMLRKGLRDPDGKAVQAAVEGLTQLRAPDISGSLMKGLKDPTEAIRVNSAENLSAFHERPVQDALTEALQRDPSPAVRRAALRALANSAGASVFEPALALIRSKDADSESKENAVQSLQSVTGQNFGLDAAAWTRWWQAHRRAPGKP